MKKENSKAIIVGVSALALGFLLYFGFRKNGWFRKKQQLPEAALQAAKDAYEALTFAVGKATILPQSFPSLNELSKALSDNPSWMLTLEGHTDNTGSEPFNQGLSKSRALAVKTYLTTKGIDAARITATGAGSTKPIATNDTEAGRELNRRVEFTIVKSNTQTS